MKLNIKEIFQKIKPYENDIILVFVIVFVALIAFGLGRLSAVSEKKIPITIENMSDSIELVASATTTVFVANEKLFVASKNGTRYHYPWCPGASTIKEENKIWFSGKEEAEKSGYTPAGKCKGL